ncbi:MAG: DUF998 domain-containing protein [Thermoplasmatota archaeon]
MIARPGPAGLQAIRVTAFVALGAAVLGVLALHLLEPGLNPLTHHLSDYGLSAHAWVMKGVFVASAIGSIALASLFLALFGTRAVPGASAVAGWGVCLGAMAPIADGWGHAILVYAAEFLLVAGIALLLPLLTRTPGFGTAFSWTSAGLGMVALGTTALARYPGLEQRVAVAAAFLWLFFAVARMPVPPLAERRQAPT